MTAIAELRAPRRDLPRYRPGYPLPSYRYIPGLHPHPVRDPRGHSFGVAESLDDLAGWNPRDWPLLDPWLWGADLYNRFYFWEAHEAWESLWRSTDRGSEAGLLLQGLIQIAAALLKVHLRSTAGAMRLSTTAIEKLTVVSTRTPFLMGMDVVDTTHEMQIYFSPLARQVLPSLDDGVPVVRLELEPDRRELRS